MQSYASLNIYCKKSGDTITIYANAGSHGGVAKVASDGTASRSHALMGDFSKVHIAQFGGLDILFDPYTNAGTGEARMVVTSLVDGNAVQNNTAFIKIDNA